MRSRLTAVLAVSLIAVCDADTQRLTDAVVGTRVRLDTTDGALVIGTIVSVDPDSVRVSTNAIGTILSLPLSRVVSYELSLGRNRARGAKRGAAVGGALGVALIVSTLRGDTVSVNRQRDDRHLAVPIAIGLTAVGAAIGAAIAPERWEPPARLHSRLSVNTCRLQCLALRYRF